MPDAASTQMIATAPGSPQIQQGATANGAPLSLNPSAVTPYVLPTGGGASHPVMDFIHNWSVAQLGLAGVQMAQQEHEKASQRELLSNALIAQPQLAASQDFMKTLGKYSSPEFANALGQHAQISAAVRAQQQQDLQKQMAGLSSISAEPMTAGAAADPFEQHIAGVEQKLNGLRGLEAQWAADPNVPASAKKILDDTIKSLDSHLEKYRYESPEAKQAAAAAEATGRLGVENAPTNVAAEVSKAAKKSGAEAGATIAAGGTPAALDVLRKREAITKAEANPLTDVAKRATAEATLGKQYDDVIEPKLFLGGAISKTATIQQRNARKQAWVAAHFTGVPANAPAPTSGVSVDEIVKRHAGL